MFLWPGLGDGTRDGLGSVQLDTRENYADGVHTIPIRVLDRPIAASRLRASLVISYGGYPASEEYCSIAQLRNCCSWT